MTNGMLARSVHADLEREHERKIAKGERHES
jgi:hypothetical protein